jgi:hypothetical protein
MSEESTATPQTITIDGVEHELASFSIEVQRLISIHQKWEQKLAEDRLEVARGEAAIRELKRELIGKIKEELSPAEEVPTQEAEVIA